MLLNFAQSIVDSFSLLLSNIVLLLPLSPFQGIYNLVIDNELLSFLAWIVPFPQIISFLQAWLFAVATFYVYSIILRWIKAIE